MLHTFPCNQLLGSIYAPPRHRKKRNYRVGYIFPDDYQFTICPSKILTKPDMSRPNSKQLLAEYYLASPPPGAFLKRHLFGHNRRLLLQLQKVTPAVGDTRGRAVPAYDARYGGSFIRRLAGCFKNESAKDIVIVASGSDEPGETEVEGEDSALATITRVPANDAGGSEKLVVTFFDGATWGCERLPSGGFQFTPLSGADSSFQASWDLDSGDQSKGQGYFFSISASAVGSPSTTRSPTPKSPGAPRRKGPDVLARMDAERIQVFSVRPAPKGSFLGMFLILLEF